MLKISTGVSGSLDHGDVPIDALSSPEHQAAQSVSVVGAIGAAIGAVMTSSRPPPPPRREPGLGFVGPVSSLLQVQPEVPVAMVGRWVLVSVVMSLNRCCAVRCAAVLHLPAASNIKLFWPAPLYSSTFLFFFSPSPYHSILSLQPSTQPNCKDPLSFCYVKLLPGQTRRDRAILTVLVVSIARLPVSSRWPSLNLALS